MPIKDTPLDSDDEIELSEFNKKQQARATQQKISSAAKFIEALDFIAIYTMFMEAFLLQFYLEIGKYFMLPIAIAASLVEVILAWRQVYLDGKPRSIVRALVETVTTAAISVAMIGVLAASTVFALAAPIIFTATTAAKTLYHCGACAYYTYKFFDTPTPEKKEKYLSRAVEQGAIATIGAIATAAVTLVFLLGQTVAAGLGIAAGVLSAGMALYKGIQAFSLNDAPATPPLADQEAVESDEADLPVDDKLTSSSKCFQKFGISEITRINEEEIVQPIQQTITQEEEMVEEKHYSLLRK